MADVKWIKIVTDIFDDEKMLLIEALPDADAIIVIWFKLLCLAGKQNNNGVFVLNDRIAYTNNMLATIFRRKEATVQLALKTFEELGMIEIVNDIITIPNWGKYQKVDQLERRTEYMRGYMRDYREKQRKIACKTNCKPNNKPNVSDAEEEVEEDIEYICPPIIPPQDVNTTENLTKKTGETSWKKTLETSVQETIETAFEHLWEIYPKKTHREASFRAFKRVIIQGEATLEHLLAKVAEHSVSEQWLDQTPKYVPSLSRWLNEKRWNDVLPPPKGNGYIDQYGRSIDDVIERTSSVDEESGGIKNDVFGIEQPYQDNRVYLPKLQTDES